MGTRDHSAAARTSALLVVALATILPPSPCPAEWLYFARTGARSRPRSLREDGRILVETPSGRYAFREKDFRAIVARRVPRSGMALPS